VTVERQSTDLLLRGEFALRDAMPKRRSFLAVQTATGNRFFQGP
jgi:hypothetical protein